MLPALLASPALQEAQGDTRVPVDVSRAAVDDEVQRIAELFDLNIEQLDVLRICASWFRATDDAPSAAGDDASEIALVHGVFGSGKRCVRWRGVAARA